MTAQVNARVMITAATLVDFAYPILISFCVFLSSLFLDSAIDDTYRLYTVAVKGSTEFLASNAHDYVFNGCGISGEVRQGQERRKGEEREKTPTPRGAVI